MKPNERKDIYAYINKFVIHLYQLSTEQTKPETEAIKKLLPKQDPYWTALVKAT